MRVGVRDAMPRSCGSRHALCRAVSVAATNASTASAALPGRADCLASWNASRATSNSSSRRKHSLQEKLYTRSAVVSSD